ncbi:MAG: hypothetical protein MUC88_10405 [Planctomycetes bacterium]|jgi:hypothetical protein|nr:hypothetical protein [Planctomycetota bacterium]
MTMEPPPPLQVSPPTLAHVRSLKALDPELAYLALLTRRGLKPVSRWEKPLAESGLVLLGRMGLIACPIPRTVKTGRQVVETVFGISSAWVRLYERRFAGQPVDKSSATVRVEGFLFGYPPCCVEQYVRHPYAAGDLPEEDRRVLFHWPCRDCQPTSLLLPVYRQVWAVVESC